MFSQFFIFIGSLILNFLILIFAVIIWKNIWVGTFDCNIPKGNYEFNFPISHDRKLQYKVRTIKDIFFVFKKLLWQFDYQYWIDNCGFDAYGYLFFQRRIMVLLYNLGWFGAIYIILNYLSYLISIYSENWSIVVRDYISPFNQIFWIFIIAIFFMYNLLKSKQQLQLKYLKSMYEKNQRPDLDWLKMRSIHVKGIPENDIGGIQTINSIKQFIQDNQIGGEILSAVVIPSYGKLLQYEKTKLELQYGFSLCLSNQQSCLTRFLIKKQYKDQTEFDKQMQIIENKIQQLLQEPFQCSGHAVICLDKLRCVEQVLERFPEKRNLLQIACLQIHDKITNTQSTHKKYSFDQYSHHDEKLTLICSEVSDPLDYLWLNLEGEGRGVYFWRRVLLALVILVFCIFFTTPVAIFTLMQQVPLLAFFKFEWVKDYPFPLNIILQNYLPSLCIVGLNLLIFIMIDYISYYEGYSRRSYYQLVIFKRNFFYLIFNILIIPSFLVSSNQPLYYIFLSPNTLNNTSNFDFSKLYSENEGLIYATFIMQSASLSAFLYLNRFPDLFSNYFSPWITHFYRTYINDTETYLRQEFDMFIYGYNAAQMLVVLLIGCLFFFSTPMVFFAMVVYFFVRHIVDSYLLLVVYKREMESSGQFVEQLIVYGMMACSIFVLIMAIYFWIYEQYYNSAIATMIFIGCAYIAILSDQPLISTNIYQDKVLTYTQRKNIETTAEQYWHKLYQHPLIVNFQINDAKIGEHTNQYTVSPKKLQQSFDLGTGLKSERQHYSSFHNSSRDNLNSYTVSNVLNTKVEQNNIQSHEIQNYITQQDQLTTKFYQSEINL